MMMTYQYRDACSPDPSKGTIVPSPTRGTYRHVVKPALDIVLVLIAAIPVLLVLIPIMALIALDGASPVYVQDRIGRNGRVFRMFKLRTMVANADTALEVCLAADPAARAEWDRTQKLRHDPRVTRIGAILRKTSIDELPQLWNVLRGDMSIVGPRPMMCGQQAIYPGTEYYAMRPGITGLWQVSVRNQSSFSERAAFDRAYHHGMSLRMDIGVILKTVRVVMQGTGC
jgi:lipopolysaccharide/colanic/teichoic acid biosynthesis glycosyltransferase